MRHCFQWEGLIRRLILPPFSSAQLTSWALPHRAGKEASESDRVVVLGHGQDDACQVQQHVVVLKDRSLDGFLHVALIHLQVCRFLVCLRDLVILDGLHLRPLAPAASVRPHCRFASVIVIEASHLAPLVEHCCDQHRIAR